MEAAVLEIILRSTYPLFSLFLLCFLVCFLVLAILFHGSLVATTFVRRFSEILAILCSLLYLMSSIFTLYR